MQHTNKTVKGKNYVLSTFYVMGTVVKDHGDRITIKLHKPTRIEWQYDGNAIATEVTVNKDAIAKTVNPNTEAGKKALIQDYRARLKPNAGGYSSDPASIKQIEKDLKTLGIDPDSE